MASAIGEESGNVPQDVDLEILAAFDQLPVHLIAHAGKNAKMVAQMRNLFARRTRHRGDRMGARIVLGWVENMWDLFEAADLYIGKPGGMQVAEGLARGTPVFAFDPIPGTEEQNAAWIERKGAGLFLKRPVDVVAAGKNTLAAPQLLEKMKHIARALGKPDSATTIGRAVSADLQDRTWLHPRNAH